MRLGKILFFLSALVTTAFATPSVDVVGGHIAPRRYPFMASLQVRKQQRPRNFVPICGASLIDVQWLLTAAHCVKYSDRSYRVIMNRYDLRRKSATQVFRAVKEVRIHPRYSGTTNDIALLRVDPVWLNRQMRIADEQVAAGAPLLAIGWGATKYAGPVVQVLRQVELPVVPFAKCAKAYAGIDYDKQICAGYEEGGKDTCGGDSGGPLFTNATLPVLIGITSFGRGCAEPGYYGVYTRVSHYIDWIESEKKIEAN